MGPARRGVRIAGLLRAAISALVALAMCGCPRVVFDGPPSLECGTGLFEFEPVEPGQTVPISYPLQGGTVLFIALRVRNMAPRDMIVGASTSFAADGATIDGPLEYTVSLARGDGDEWIYAGLPIQVDAEQVRGQGIVIDVTLIDRDGRMAGDSLEIVPQ